MRQSGRIIEKGTGKFLLRMYLGVDERGKRRYHSQVIHCTKTKAQKIMRQWLRDRDEGKFLTPVQGTVADWMTHWLDTIISLKVRRVTLDGYRFVARQYILPTLGSHLVAELSKKTLQDWIGGLTKAALKPRTVRQIASVLRNALDTLVDLNELPANPARGLTLPTMERPDITPLTTEEAQRLIEGVRGDAFEALWLLMLTTGMRPGEVLALRWGDIRDGTAYVTRSLSWTSQGPMFEQPKTKAGKRQVPLMTVTLEALSSRRAKRPEAYDGDLIFSTRSGGPLEWRIVRGRRWARLLRQLELPHIRPYDLRHTNTTLLLAAGVSPTVITARLGHKSTAFLLDTYGHVLPSQQDAATKELTRLLDGKETG